MKEKAVKILIDNINNSPEEWTIDKYIARNNNHGVEIWIANGVSFCNPYKVKESSLDKMGNWSFWQKRRVWKAFQGLPSYLIIKALDKKKK